MNVFKDLQALPDELLTSAQIRRKEKMEAVTKEYKDIREKYGDNSVISVNRICEFLAVKHGISVRTTRYYLESAELIKS